MEKIERQVFRVYAKCSGSSGHWMDKEFAIHKTGEANPPQIAITQQEAEKIAGKYGRVYRITTTAELIYLGQNAPAE
jgi:hypothetical protein